MNRFLSFFRKVGTGLGNPETAALAHEAGAIVGGFNPGIGALIETIAGAAQLVETQAAANRASGADKKEQVKAILDVTAPVTLQVLAGVSGKPITNPAAIAPTLDKLIDATVELLNQLAVFKHSQGAGSQTALPNGAVQLSAPLL